MTPADVTLAPLLRGRRARAPFVREPRRARQPAIRARHAPALAAWWRSPKGARVLDAAAEKVSWDLAGGRSTSVDHPGPPSGSRVRLRTPIGERDADLRGEHRAETSVQLGARRYSEGVRAFARSRLDRPWNLAEAARSRSHFSLVANRRRGSVNRSPQGAIRGGFAVSPQNSEPFARCACRDGALAGARRERRASAMSAAWDSSPALSPVPWGERNGEAFNCVPGDQQSAPLVNSFGVRDGAEPVDHRGEGSRGATNGARTASRPRAPSLRAGRRRLWTSAKLIFS